MEEKKCLCGGSDVRVVTCSGASNVGQIANQAAIEKSHEIAFHKKDCLLVIKKVKEEMGYKQAEPTTCLNRGEKVYDYTE